MKVYVVIENGSWDFEFTDDLKVFDSFEKAKKDFEQRKQRTKEDMENWIDLDNTEIEENIDEENEYLFFTMYESGEYTKLHNDIKVIKIEVE